MWPFKRKIKQPPMPKLSARDYIKILTNQYTEDRNAKVTRMNEALAQCIKHINSLLNEYDLTWHANLQIDKNYSTFRVSFGKIDNLYWIYHDGELWRQDSTLKQFGAVRIDDFEYELAQMISTINVYHENITREPLE